MNNEIKEILDRLEGRKNWYLHQQKNNGVFNDEDYMAYMLLDYITNLEQENERIENECINQINQLGELTSRIYKAIDYINKTIENNPLTDFDCGSNNACNNLLNILQNGSDSE